MNRRTQQFRAMPGERKAHRAKLIGENGAVSPLCATEPRRIPMGASSKETWTTADAEVTCPACIEKLKAEGRR